ncbi:hypothetical protein ACIBHY_53755 [Nonomuraea sp. NPDC050547]
MVNARVAGVLHTLNPVTGRRSEMVAEAVRGARRWWPVRSSPTSTC